MGFALSLFGTNRQKGGHAARSSGKEFENAIEASQNDEHGPVCTLVKIKNFAKRIFDVQKQETLLIEERSPFDFCGSVWKPKDHHQHGIGIFLDAKSLTDSASFPIHDPKIVKLHQIRALQRLEEAGAFAGFLVKCGRRGDVRWLWASHAAAAARFGRPLQWDDPAWEVLGPWEYGRSIPLRKLFDSYQ